MSDTAIEQTTANSKAEEWAERIAEQQRSGIFVKMFPGTRADGILLLCLAQTAPGKRAGTVCPGGEECAASGAPGGDGTGTGVGDRRAAAYWCRRGRRNLADRAGRLAGMIHLPASVRVYLCLTPCDMRKSFDSLHALVREHLELDAFAGHLFVFTSRRKDRVKILYWDGDGFAVWSKRLEEGSYAVPFRDGGGERRREITVQELGALLSGIDLSTARRRKRYQRANA